MDIGEVAEQLGLPASTIRYYEKEGLIERQVRFSGRRQFNDQAVVALQFVQLALAAGFTIAETKALLEHHHDNPTSKGLWRPFVEQKQVCIKQKIKDLQLMERILDDLNRCECESITECVRAADCNTCLKL